MQPAESIFNKITAEVPLLKKLIDRGKLFFVGEQETIQYLQNLFEPRNSHSSYDYYDWKEGMEALEWDGELLSTYQAIVVSSIDNEHIISDWVCQELNRLQLEVPVLKLFSDIFVNLMSGCPLLQTSDREIVYPKIAYAIATTPRSGSTVLSGTLGATKIAGFPKEHLRFPSQTLAQNCQFDYVRYLEILMQHQTTENSVFGTKFIGHFFQSHYKSGFDFNRLLERFNFIYLRRQNKIAQATSILIGQKTKTWHVSSNKKYQNYKTKLSQIQVEDSDLEQLHFQHQSILYQERFWERFFEEHNISPLIIEYEQFIGSPEEQINKVLKYLKITDEDRVKILPQYQYKFYNLTKKFNFFNNDNRIRIALSNKKIQSDFSKLLIQTYKEKYNE
ncbi:MAG: Stf0 sulfotransferase family protein [Hydrococcus sp. Prado102]|jgi:LPS sulfotransferase NodH|nr:Stf0 sulfotransferase family protein [Hydrococcus sp. Prado102]